MIRVLSIFLILFVYCMPVLAAENNTGGDNYLCLAIQENAINPLADDIIPEDVTGMMAKLQNRLEMMKFGYDGMQLTYEEDYKLASKPLVVMVIAATWRSLSCTMQAVFEPNRKLVVFKVPTAKTHDTPDSLDDKDK